GVTKPVILLELGQRPANAPVLVARGIRSATDKRIDRGLFPGPERPAAGRHMDGNPVPGIALRQRPRPILRTLPLVDDGNHRPWHAGFGRDRLVSGLGRWSGQMAGNRCKPPRQLGVSPAL